jgi:hypothetical protein
MMDRDYTPDEYESLKEVLLLLARKNMPSCTYPIEWGDKTRRTICHICGNQFDNWQSGTPQLLRNHLFQHLKEKNLLPFV